MAIKKVVGVILIIFGIIGLFLPILQGILMIIAGLSLIGVKKNTIKKYIKKFKLFKNEPQKQKEV